jgi:hypothetical protein
VHLVKLEGDERVRPIAGLAEREDADGAGNGSNGAGPTTRDPGLALTISRVLVVIS